MEITPGLVGEVELIVAAPDTADALGNRGVHVLATPRLVGLLEEAAIAAVQARLPAGAGTVGTRIDVKHLAATPVGMRVRARAVVREVDGRRYVYDVEVVFQSDLAAFATRRGDYLLVGIATGVILGVILAGG